MKSSALSASDVFDRTRRTEAAQWWVGRQRHPGRPGRGRGERCGLAGFGLMDCFVWQTAPAEESRHETMWRPDDVCNIRLLNNMMLFPFCVFLIDQSTRTRHFAYCSRLHYSGPMVDTVCGPPCNFKLCSSVGAFHRNSWQSVWLLHDCRLHFYFQLPS